MLAKAKLLMEKRANDEELTETEQLDMQQFINNYSMAETETQNMDAKLKTLTFMAYVVLGIYDYANNAYRQLVNDVLPRMKSVRIKSLIEEQMQLYQKIIRNAPE